jgi:hypothetical protein
MISKVDLLHGRLQGMAQMVVYMTFGTPATSFMFPGAPRVAGIGSTGSKVPRLKKRQEI